MKLSVEVIELDGSNSEYTRGVHNAMRNGYFKPVRVLYVAESTQDIVASSEMFVPKDMDPECLENMLSV